MLYGNQSISAFTRGNMCIWMILAFQGGLLNMGGYLACHHFVSHVTGFFTLVGVELNRSNFLYAAEVLMVPGFFLLGAMLSGMLVDVPLRLRRRPGYYIVFGAMFAILLLVVIGGFNGLFGEFGEALEKSRDYTLLAVLGLACGIQNGTVTLVSKAMVRTTHLTGTTTDLGVGLVVVMNRARLKGKTDNEGLANIMRIGVIVFFALGSILGYRVYREWGFRGFALPCAIYALLFVSMLYFQVWRPRFHAAAFDDGTG